MCIGFWSLEDPEYALIICSNRDEYLSRPTTNAYFHSYDKQEPQVSASVLSGRDELGGGTWFGLNRNGKVALLTNITEPPASFPTSRGYLVASYLGTASGGIQDYVEMLRGSKHSQAYAGFNLVLFSPLRSSQGLLSYDSALVTNSGGGGSIKSRFLEAKERYMGSVSNGVDGRDAKDWPKVQMIENLWTKLLNERSTDIGDEEEFIGRLFELLAWQSSKKPSNRFELRTSIQIPPILMTSSIAPDASPDGPEYYGTRLATILLIRRDGQVLFRERDIWQLDSIGNVVYGDPRKDRIFRFRINS